MGASASTRSLLSSSSSKIDASKTFSDQNSLHSVTADKLALTVRLVLNNEIIAGSFESFLEDTKSERLMFVKYFAELEKLKAICSEENKKNCTDLVIRDMVLKNSTEIHSLHFPSKKVCKKPIELHYEGVITQCLSPLLSHTTALPEQFLFREACREMLTNCQSSLLIYLMEELGVFVKSQRHFLRHLVCRIPAQRQLAHQILLNVQASDRVNNANKVVRCRAQSEDDCTIREDSLSSFSGSSSSRR